jgi:PAS domain S-box-containing protein
MYAVRRTISSYLIVMTLVALLSTAAGFLTLYHLSLTQEQAHLQSVAMTYGHLLEGMAERGVAEKEMVDLLNKMPLALTASRQTQELVFARKEKEGMVFLYRQSEPTPTTLSSLSQGDTVLGQPMRRALNGQEGIFTGVDYSGVTVLSAHVPILKGRWGLVAKIDLDEFRKPFVQSGIFAFILILLLLSAGAWGINWLSHSWVVRLFDSEARYRALFDGIPDGVFLFGYYDGGWPTKFLEFNQSACRRLGYTKDELSHLGPNDILVGISDDEKRNLHDEILKNGFAKYKIEVLAKAGERFPAEAHFRLIQLHGLAHVVCILHDATCWSGS